MCVHCHCYGLRKVPEEDFFCESCTEHKAIRMKAKAKASVATLDDVFEEEKVPRPKCVLCRKSSGMMKKSTCGQWVHLLCVVFTGSVGLTSPIAFSCCFGSSIFLIYCLARLISDLQVLIFCLCRNMVRFKATDSSLTVPFLAELTVDERTARPNNLHALLPERKGLVCRTCTHFASPSHEFTVIASHCLT